MSNRKGIKWMCKRSLVNLIVMTISMMFQVTKVKVYSVENIGNFECLKKGPQVWECFQFNVLPSLILWLAKLHFKSISVPCFGVFKLPCLLLFWFSLSFFAPVQLGPLLCLLLCFAYFSLISSSFSACFRCTLVPKHFSWRLCCQYLPFISVRHMFCILANRIGIWRIINLLDWHWPR